MGPDVTLKAAAALHQNSIVLDTHCDTLTVLLDEGRRLAGPGGPGQLDLPRMKAGGIKAQFFAAFIAPEYRNMALKRTLELIDIFYREIKANSKDIAHVRSAAELEQAVAAGKIAAILSIEGGEALAGSLGVLRVLYQAGVRSITLTWNGRNELGEGACAAGGGAAGPGAGLTAFGVSVVKEMNELGMLVDISHLSERGFWDVIEISTQPVIASHSNCRALCDHPRNLTDAQIQAIARRGGVIGVNFVPDFLGGVKPAVDDVLAHIEHLIAVGGEDCAGLGSDFDGTAALPAGLNDCSCLPLLTSGMLARGYSEKVIKKVLGGNFLRVIKEVIK